MNLTHSNVSCSMKPITAVINAVGKGEVTIKFRNGMTAVWKTDRGFKYGERVLVFYDHCHLVVKDVIYPKELNLEDTAAPEMNPLERSTDNEVPVDLELESSLPTPDGRLLEFFRREMSELELEGGASFSTSDVRLEELEFGDDI